MLKKFTLIIVISSLVFSPLILFPQRVQGAAIEATKEAAFLGIFTVVTQGAASAADIQRPFTVPVFDVVQYSQIRAVETAKAAKDTASNILQALVKLLLEMLRKRLLDMLVDQIVNWIQNGGTPQFVSNWQGFLKDAFGAAVGDVILQTNLAFLCSPFKLQIQLSLLPVQRFSQQIQCTLDDIVRNVEDFYQDFRNGGWIAYNEAWQPQNNYYGVMLMAHDEMLRRGAAAAEAARNEALAGKGFLSVKRCKGGGYTAEELGQMWETGTTGYQKDYKGKYCLPEQMENITPGAVVGEMTSKAVGSDIDYLLSAKELEQYVAAIVNAVIYRVIKEGVGLIKGSSEYQDTTDYTQPYEDTLTEIQRQEKERIIAEYQLVIDDRNIVLANKNQSVSSTQQLVAIFERIKGTTCQPPVTDNDISGAEAEVNRLRTEIDSLQGFISEVQTLKTEAENTSPDYRLQEMDILIRKYNEFITKYGSIVIEVYSGSAKQASQEEAQRKQTELTNAQARLTSCGISP